MNISTRARALGMRLGALFFLLVLGGNAFGTAFYAANSSGTLRVFDTSAPGSAGRSLSITGLGLGESIIGIDIRPLDQKLYALTKDGSNAGRLYAIDASSGAATLVGMLVANPTDSVPYTALSGTRFGMSFNPTVDRIRVVSDTGQNLRIVPQTAIAIHDADLNPGTPHVAAAAYINSYAGAASTALYVIDPNTDQLYLQTPANNGTLVLVGNLGVNMVDLVAFDITTVGTSNSGFATALVGGNINLYTIDLASGAAASQGMLNGNFQAVGIAIVPDHLFADDFD